MLKTIEQKLRDKERMEIIRADQDTARTLQRFVKKGQVNDKESLTLGANLLTLWEYLG